VEDLGIGKNPRVELCGYLGAIVKPQAGSYLLNFGHHIYSKDL
jgi:hypothetical protein